VTKSTKAQDAVEDLDLRGRK